MGLHANTAAGRSFVELQGWVNQYISQKSHQAIFMVSGIPILIKDTWYANK
jgi:adenosylcobinamide kinase / adenosylcobinamide-phosphate guanylyltransferase